MQLTKDDLIECYFYKTELIQLCRERGLPTYGTKAELNQYLILFLNGTNPSDIKPFRTNNNKISAETKITFDTRLIGDGFKFNSEARLLFANYYHVKKFSFKKEMAIIKRRVETQKQTDYTIRDFITEFENTTQISDNPEEQTYHWNNFVKDFNRDPASKNFNSRMKTAARLWNIVKATNKPKKYSHDLLHRYSQQTQDP